MSHFTLVCTNHSLKAASIEILPKLYFMVAWSVENNTTLQRTVRDDVSEIGFIIILYNTDVLYTFVLLRLAYYESFGQLLEPSIPLPLPFLANKGFSSIRLEIVTKISLQKTNLRDIFVQLLMTV